MRTVGQMLREARLAKQLTLEDVEKNIKIRVELLKALEEDNFDKLPPYTFVQGFIKNYGKFLNLDAVKLIAFFRRDYETKKHPPQILESFRKPLGEGKFNISPPRVIALAIILVVVGFFTYLWFEYRQFVGAPQLSITSPQDQASLEVPTVLVSGTTDPDSKVSINNQEVAVDKLGNFKEEIKLSSSVNTLLITSTSKFGQVAKIERTVFVKK